MQVINEFCDQAADNVTDIIQNECPQTPCGLKSVETTVNIDGGALCLASEIICTINCQISCSESLRDEITLRAGSAAMESTGLGALLGAVPNGQLA